MDTKNEQDSYLQGMMATIPVKQRRRRKDESESSKPDRGSTYMYEIQTRAGKLQVCKKAFINIHGITNERVRRLTNLLSQGKSPKDKRGKCKSGNANPGTMIDSIREHIASFPTKEGHYVNQECKYLSERLNVRIMHQMFKEKHPSLDVKYSFYRKIFLEHFELKFGRPQVDTCCSCEELEMKIKSKFLNDTAKRVYVAEKMVHIRRAKKFYKKLQDISALAKCDDSVGAVCIDFMQNLNLPCIPVQETFYLRQVTVNVFCVHNLMDDSATFFVYHEGMGCKGPNEVASFLMQYLRTNMPEKVETLHIFSDGCGGQNKNHTVLRVLAALVATGKYMKIEQYFPIRGHSFLPCDRDFAVLKRKLKLCDRVYTLKEYVELIITSSQKNKFQVVIPDCSDIIDYKRWWPRYFKKCVTSVETSGRGVPRLQKVQFKISQFMHFTHVDGVVVARTFIDGLLCETFRLQSDQQLHLPSTSAYPDGCLPIKKQTLQDIRKLKEYLPQEEEVATFYEELYQWPTRE